MRKSGFTILCAIMLLFSSFFFSNCSSSSIKIQDPVVGIIRIVGNEPFINLAVNIDGKEVYILECSPEIRAELYKNQGKVYEIKYKDVKQSSDGIVLIVEKVIPINTK